MNPVSELAFFTQLIRLGSLAATARELNLTPPAVSKRLAQLEQRLGVRLLNRTTRSISLTAEGELYLNSAQRILGEIEEMERQVSSSRAKPKGLLRVNAPLGFGRTHVCPAISSFVRHYPEVEVQLHLTDRPINLPDDAIDVAIRFGDLPDSRLIARKIAANRRRLCAAPSYLEAFGNPESPKDLMQHNCIVLRQNDAAFGIWRLSRGKQSESVKVRGNLSTNDGEVALNWALEGHGILMRAEWNLASHLSSGRLVEVLSDYETPPADIYAVYLERLNLSAKVSFFIEHLREFFSHKSDGFFPLA
ncbi:MULTISPECIES: LysR family transcriptional regulator [Pseudomonadaceae]|jgi:DNA-binding transcriptional LysR family regulator|uniref:DNA-binding transcriptional regulator, LysR family n=1 Tax=Ectopseudomonas chengduensis TaxID=489632 RepID=A0A1G6WNV2_9GAMM|nr:MULTISPECIES: LysR family transcriptional regulator [Pseudomonas]MBP3064370.1 LysR family transcriptional regulator [Pseudomonas chengduensis]MBU3054715.1 LysR family transcriptional regulator [Pseudomonas indica]MDH0959300.1 LysR family transcriptional regulator [Pseudomonas chengduensis]MDH1536815.1 LysR family transcriptional regulator [Pseudomonas chengduensis]MPT16962.1 LysR family transcriptional regulator [Pseudomonas sp.]